MANNALIMLLMPPVAWLLYCAYCLALNYRLAREVNISLIVLLISSNNILWILMRKYLISLFQWLSFDNDNFTRFNRHDWQINDDAKVHLKFDDAFIIVTSEQNWLYICNAKTLIDMFRRNFDFSRSLEVLDKTESIEIAFLSDKLIQ